MKITSTSTFRRTFVKRWESISSICITKYQMVVMSFIIGSCHKRVDPPKLLDSCHLQYKVSKWFSAGQPLIFSACPDSISLTFLQRDTGNRFNTEFKIIDGRVNVDSTFWIDEHCTFRVSGFVLKIEEFTKTSVRLTLWYNYGP